MQELLGRVVTSRAGRDEGDRYVVVAVLDVDTVLVADGRRRTMDRPKKKNVKHVTVHRYVPVDLATKLTEGQTLRDEEIREALARAAEMGEGPSADSSAETGPGTGGQDVGRG